MKTRLIVLAVLAVTLLAAGTSMAGIAGTKHDLSPTGPGNTSFKANASSTDQLCIFCHTPHFASSLKKPLWNKVDGAGTGFVAYGNTIAGTNTPTSFAGLNGITKACLSCHDGVSAINSALNAGGGAAGTITMQSGAGNVTLAGSSVGNISNDISNDHPVSITYDTTQGANNKAGLRSITTSASGKTIIKVTNTGTLVGDTSSATSTTVECSSCHDPHGTGFNYFLRYTTGSSGLCLACHAK